MYILYHTAGQGTFTLAIIYILYHTAGQGTFTPSYCTCTHYVICQSINTSSYVIWYSNYWCMYMCLFAQCVVRYVCCDNDLHNVCIRVCVDVCVGMSLCFSVLKWHRFFFSSVLKGRYLVPLELLDQHTSKARRPKEALEILVGGETINPHTSLPFPSLSFELKTTSYHKFDISAIDQHINNIMPLTSTSMR